LRGWCTSEEFRGAPEESSDIKERRGLGLIVFFLKNDFLGIALFVCGDTLIRRVSRLHVERL
jgi:hypothetical protein